jgi:CRISPR-associated regulatory protein, DevR family
MNDNNLYVQGFVLLDVDVASLNNNGKSTSSNNDNVVETKSVFKNGNKYVYVDGEAWRYWWRETLQKKYGWNMSPITRDKEICYTAADPIHYPDDDMFGYMRAPKKSQNESDTNRVNRSSPLKNSALCSVASVDVANSFSTMSRQDGAPVPFKHQEYSAILKGMFSINVAMAGTFSSYNRAGFLNVTDGLRETAISSNEVDSVPDPYGSGQLVRLKIDERKKRITETILALKNISGGAMQTCNMCDVTPKFIILASTDSGNHPFSHVVNANGVMDKKAVLNVEGIEEVLNDYKDDFKGKVFIGRRKGFFDEYDQKLHELAEKYDFIGYMSVNLSIDEYVKQLNDQIK